MPILFNFDGQGSCKAIFILKPQDDDLSLLAITPPPHSNVVDDDDKRTPELVIPRVPVWICEKIPTTSRILSATGHITSVTAEDSWQLVREPSRDVNNSWLTFVRIDFHPSDAEPELEIEVDGWADTTLIMCAERNNNNNNSDDGAVVMVSEVEGDPFESE